MRFISSLALSIAFLLSGCAAQHTTIKLYDGPALDQSEVTTIIPERMISMVLDVGRKPAGGSCWTNCMFLNPVQILPGKHEFSTNNLHISRDNFEKLKKPVPSENQDVFPVKRVGVDLFTIDSFAFDFSQSLEKGASYILSMGYKVGENGNKDYFVWWEKLPNQKSK